MPGLSQDIEAAGRAALYRRLDPQSPAPLAVGFSGGADSLLTLLTAKAWAARHGRRLLVLTVDHRLQPASSAWTRRCSEVAAELGLGFRALAWDGPKPATGLPAAARAARHRLLAGAAREAGAKVLLLGHTASDIAEGEVMRAQGANIGSLREWSPSPAWPEGRGLFCLRPLLGLAREGVRERLSGWTWIDDPANQDVRYGRVRARTTLQIADHPREGGDPGFLAPSQRDVCSPVGQPPFSNKKSLGPRLRGDEWIGGAAHLEAAGFARLPANLSTYAAFPRLLQILLLCISGGETPARGSRVEALAHDLARTATLGGCKLTFDNGRLLIARELGRAAPRPLDLPQNEPVVWDGRFEIVALEPDLAVRPLKGLAARLPAAERRTLSAIPAAARPSLPAIARGRDQTVTCPFLAEAPGVRIRALAAERFASACGLIAHEAEIKPAAHGAFTLDVLSWTPETEKGPSG